MRSLIIEHPVYDPFIETGVKRMAAIHRATDIKLLPEGFDTWLGYWESKKKKAQSCSNVQCLRERVGGVQVRYAYAEQTKLVPLCESCDSELSKGKILRVLDAEILPIPFLDSREVKKK